MRKFFKVASVQEDKCQTAPCRQQCPADVDIPTYIGLISKGKFEEAYRVIRSGIPFPSVCGRVCHHPCETACRRIGKDAALSIRALKRFPCDYLLMSGGFPTPAAKECNQRKIAIVGSGPAGLSAAYYLAQKNYAITVFESNKAAGGMMMFGIPDYRLPKEILNEEIAAIIKSGVRIEKGITIGKDKGIADLFAEGYESIFLAVGANCSNRLELVGEELTGVYSGIEFLFALNNRQPVSLIGKKVAVIGAGNVAADTARSAVRLGAAEVTIYYRRAKRDMPIIESELIELDAEGIKIKTMVAPVRIIGEAGQVTGLELVNMQAGKLDTSNRYTPVEISGSEHIVAADIVIAAIGYHPDARNIDSRLDTTRWGSIAVNKETMATSIPSVFAGGDCVSGATSVVEAIAEGKRAARIIDRALGGNGLLENFAIDMAFDGAFSSDSSSTARVAEKSLHNISNFSETNLGYSLNMALAEAERCLHCDLVCNVCESVCPVLAAKSKKLGSTRAADINADICTGCGICEQRCPDQAILLLDRAEARVLEVTTPSTLTEEVDKLCRKAHMNPEQVVCYCHRVKASEVAAAILSGATTPEDVAKLTGARTGCGVLCANSIMRQFEAAGISLNKAPGHQWYGGVPTIWKLSDEVLQKYDKEFRLLSDRDCMNKLFPDK